MDIEGISSRTRSCHPTWVRNGSKWTVTCYTRRYLESLAKTRGHTEPHTVDILALKNCTTKNKKSIAYSLTKPTNPQVTEPYLCPRARKIIFGSHVDRCQSPSCISSNLVWWIIMQVKSIFLASKSLHVHNSWCILDSNIMASTSMQRRRSAVYKL